MRKIILSLVALLALAAPLAVTAASPASATTGPQRQAIGSAQDYLRAMPFSKQGLIDQLSSPYGAGFSVKIATYAVNHIKVNWNKQAVKSANSYLKVMHFSCDGLIDQLESPYGAQFTHNQAVYGAYRTSAC